MSKQVLDSVAILRRSPLFEELEDADLQALARQAHRRCLHKGQTLFLQGDPVQYLHLVLSGLIKVYRPDPKGQRQVVLHLEGPYRLVAAVALFLEKPRYPASAEALENSALLAIPRETFFHLVDSRPPVARAMIRFLARRQAQLVHLLDQLVFHQVGARLAEYLLTRHLAEGEGFRLPTNPELAAILGSVPEPVSRKLGQFFRQGLIEMKERRVWVRDAARLRALAEE
jgi:CRP/FNR family transcriptional regulator